MPRWTTLLLVGLIAYRLAYHATYLGEVPFAHATFADGAVYEAAAHDILAAPPLGTRAFYLQGAYAYLLAIGMAIRPWVSVGLLGQLLAAGGALVLFHRATVRLWGPLAGRLSSAALLACPGLMFYENKFLSASLGMDCNIAVLAAFVALAVVARHRARDQDRDSNPGRRRVLTALAAVALGVASGLSVLARPNMILALPFTMVAAYLAVAGSQFDLGSESGARSGPERGPQRSTRAGLLAIALVVVGALAAVAPMAARNLAVTGAPDIQPVHGGGTSFYIGNNPKSRGLWNDAGLLSARVGTESLELTQQLGVDPALGERDRARAIGDALYAEAWAWIRAHPGDFTALELRKIWLTVGNQQLSHDYDWLGERELLPWANRVGLSFGALMALGLLGAGACFTRRRADPAPNPTHPETPPAGLAWLLAGLTLAPLAANLLFFTSAQHRLPLVLPLAVLAGPGLLALYAGIQRWISRLPAPPLTPGLASPSRIIWVLAAIALVQGAWPRMEVDRPHPVHYYNLAMIQDQIGDPLDALASFDRAIEAQPRQPIFRMRRAHLRVRLDDLDGAERDLEVLAEEVQRGIDDGRPVPDWVLVQAELDRRTIAYERRLVSGS